MQPATVSTAPPRKKKRISSTSLIFVALALGVVFGGFFPQDQYPQVYQFFHFLSKAFINLIKGLIVPLLASTLIAGVAQTGDIKAVGRMGGKALLYFEVVTTLALVLGLVVANVFKPGEGLTLATEAASEVNTHAAKSAWDVVLHVFPSNVVRAASEGDILPVVIFSLLFGIALTRAGKRGEPVLSFFQGVADTMFKYTDMVMLLTPFGVFGSMAYNVSHMAAGHMQGGVYLAGWPAVGALLRQYAELVFSLYFAIGLMFLLVFVPIMWIVGIRVREFVRTIREPLLTAYSTASSEAALPKLLEQMVAFGVPRRVAAFVIPAGYSFNLDGSTLYLVLASLTIAQAAGIEMSLGKQISMLLVFILTSKGVAGVPRATLVIIAATSSSFGLPGDAGVAMLLAVDAVMDMARSAANVFGNGLASAVVAKWEGGFCAQPSLPAAEPLDKAPTYRTV